MFPGGRVFDLVCGEDDAFSVIKQKVFEQEGALTDQMTGYYKDVKILDESTLKDLNIKKSDLVTIQLKPQPNQ